MAFHSTPPAGAEAKEEAATVLTGKKDLPSSTTPPVVSAPVTAFRSTPPAGAEVEEEEVTGNKPASLAAPSGIASSAVTDMVAAPRQGGSTPPAGAEEEEEVTSNKPASLAPASRIIAASSAVTDMAAAPRQGGSRGYDPHDPSVVVATDHQPQPPELEPQPPGVLIPDAASFASGTTSSPVAAEHHESSSGASASSAGGGDADAASMSSMCSSSSGVRRSPPPTPPNAYASHQSSNNDSRHTPPRTPSSSPTRTWYTPNNNPASGAASTRDGGPSRSSLPGPDALPLRRHATAENPLHFNLVVAFLAIIAGVLVGIVSEFKATVDGWSTAPKVAYGISAMLIVVVLMLGIMAAQSYAAAAVQRNRAMLLASTFWVKLGMVLSVALLIIAIACKLGRWGCAAGVPSAAVVACLVAAAWILREELEAAHTVSKCWGVQAVSRCCWPWHVIVNGKRRRGRSGGGDVLPM